MLKPALLMAKTVRGKLKRRNKNGKFATRKYKNGKPPHK
jgi:hypothetical protein